MKSKLRPLGAKFDGKSRVSTENYRKNYDEIFKKNLNLKRIGGNIWIVPLHLKKIY